METLNILVLSSPVTNALNGDGAGAELCRKAFPTQNWRFLSYETCTEADIRWADVVTGNPRPEQLQAAEKLRWLHIQSAGVNGYERRDVFPNPHTVVTRAAGVHAPAMAEHALAMALSLTRRLPELYRSQLTGKWSPVHARQELHDSTVLMLGTGYLAAALAPLLQPFGCRILGLRRDTGKPTPPCYDQILPASALHEALEQADFIFSTLPLTEKTRHLLDKAAFQAMKPGAILINMGRGGTVDTTALLEALEQGRLGGAGLDVTEPEPLPNGHPLWSFPNVIITPHCSAWSDATDKRRYRRFLELLERFLRGESLPAQIDFQAGY